MLRIHRNTIYILAPVCIASLILSLVLNLLAIRTCGAASSWYTYGCNLSIGVFGSSLLSLVLAGISYRREKRTILEEYYECVEQMIIDISKYERCSISDDDKRNKILEMLNSVLGQRLHDLGNTYSQIVFLFDRPHIREYLYDIYQYFLDIRDLTRSCRRLLKNGIRDKNVMDFLDHVILRIDNVQHEGTTVTTISNRVFDDFDNELDVLIQIANGAYGLRDRFEFCKTTLTDQVFFVEDNQIEAVLKEMNASVEKENSRRISVSNWDSFPVDYLSRNDYITTKVFNGAGKLTNVEVSDKAYYYFGFKERYEKSKK